MAGEEDRTRLKLFLEMNSDLPLVSENDVRVHFFYRNGQIEQAVLIDDHVANSKQIEKAWQLIADWKERLLAYQGAHSGSDLALRQSLWDSKQEGASFSEIARSINDTLSLYISNVANDLAAVEIDELQMSDDEFQQKWSAEGRLTLSYLREVYRTLAVFGLERDADARIDDALERAESGNSPFLPGEPISVDMVRERIRSWGQRAKKWEGFVRRFPSQDSKPGW